MLSLLNHSLNELATSTRFHQFIASSGFHAHCSSWICLLLSHLTTFLALPLPKWISNFLVLPTNQIFKLLLDKASPLPQFTPLLLCEHKTSTENYCSLFFPSHSPLLIYMLHSRETKRVMEGNS